MPERIFLSQGVDHLGFLNGQLRGMMGFTALANELTQNADDARATSLTFDVTDDGLIVENNSVFSECETVEKGGCETEESVGHLCDFHRFRRVSSGNKRLEDNTIGAFGIGFTSVYQITDRPELFSGSRHWTIRPEEVEEKRVKQEPIEALDFTRFYLPWARETNTKLRSALEVAPVSHEDIERLAGDFVGAITDTIMFLKNITRIEIKKNGKAIKDVHIARDGDIVSVSSGPKTQKWLYLDGDFDYDPQRLQGRQRKNVVSISLPLHDETVGGLLFAYLPTQQRSGLPFHINADFFPTPDRKHILFDDDPQSEWNRLAIRKAAAILASELERLTIEFGPQRFWALIESFHKVAKGIEDGQQDCVFGSFWDHAKEELGAIPCAYTSTGNWVLPDEAFILRNYKIESPALTIFEQLDLEVVDPNLASYQNILISDDVGVRRFGLVDLAHALSETGLNTLIPIADAPEWIQIEENRTRLAEEIKYLKEKSSDAEEGLELIRNCALAKTCGDNFDTPASCYQAEEADRRLFTKFELGAHFLSSDNHQVIGDLAVPFSVTASIDVLKVVSKETALNLLKTDSIAYAETLKWLVNACLNANDETKQDLRDLCIWPSDGELHPLDDLVVPGGFSDHLHLASVVDLDLLGISPDRLVSIGAKELDFRTYITDQLVRFFDTEDEIDDDTLDGLVALLASRRSLIVDDAEAREAIASFPIIRCQNGEYVPVSLVCYSSDEAKSLLGPTHAYFIDPPLSYPLEIREFHTWLGIAETPRLNDLLERIDNVISKPPDRESRNLILRIFVHIAKRWNEVGDPEGLEYLRTTKWLPDRNDPSRWFHPDQLHAPYQDYIFATSGKILDIPRAEFGAALSSFVELLGIHTVPSVNLVVAHLQNMVREGKPVNNEVYTFLNQHSDDPLVETLRNWNCILLPNGAYVSPDKIFWSEHPLGRYRYRLSPEMSKYADLFYVLQVKQVPDKSDAIEVLLEISNVFAEDGEAIDMESRTVVGSCWTLLQSASQGDLEVLMKSPVVLSNSNRLLAPNTVFFDDFPSMADQLGLGEQVIARPADGWEPMLLAGVRFLSEVLVSDLVSATNQVDDNELKEKLTWGRECILRVAESARSGNDVDYEVAHLGLITFIKTDDLSIRYTLPELDLSTEVIRSAAYYDRENMRLYYDSSSTRNNISREIARSMSTQTDVGLLASGIKEVLSANSLHEAVSNLNDLGFVIIDLVRPEVARGATITQLGNETEGVSTPHDVDINDPERDEFEDEPSAHETDERRNGLQGFPHPQISGEPAGDSTPNQKRASEVSGNSKGNYEANRTGKKPSSKRGSTKKADRLISYVGSESSQGNEEDEAQTEFRRKLDDAGIQKVKDFEILAGRDPVEMQKNYKGYDIKSLSGLGSVARYIEVKSTSGEWNSYGVKLSVSQYEKALKEKGLYWLYVVERADLENSKIYCIQNPAEKVTHYCFDEGWKNLDTKS